MVGSFVYTPNIRPLLGSVVFSSLLGIHGLRHRTVPGALLFIILMAGAISWIIANGQEGADANSSS